MNAKIVLNNNNSVSLSFLVSLIYSAKFVVSNDTGPAHICSHLNKKGLVLFGPHTTAKKVNIGNNNFKVMTANKLSDLKVDDVIKKIEKELN